MKFQPKAFLPPCRLRGNSPAARMLPGVASVTSPYTHLKTVYSQTRAYLRISIGGCVRGVRSRTRAHTGPACSKLLVDRQEITSAGRKMYRWLAQFEIFVENDFLKYAIKPLSCGARTGLCTTAHAAYALTNPNTQVRSGLRIPVFICRLCYPAFAPCLRLRNFCGTAA